MHHFLQTIPEMLSKLFLSFSTLALVIYSYSTVANASEGNIRLGSWCSNTTGFQPQSSYKKDLRTFLASLASKANESSNNGYYALKHPTVIGASWASESETIYGAFLCWADTCNACVSAAIRDLPPTDCLTDKTALIWYANYTLGSNSIITSFFPPFSLHSWFLFGAKSSLLSMN